MSSSCSGKKVGKTRKGIISSPKQSSPTVETLFKKQLQQQESMHRTESASCSVNQQAEDDDVIFVKKDWSSLYFVPKKSANVSPKGDSSSSEKPYETAIHTEKRFSRRLSLRKRNHLLTNREGFVNVPRGGYSASEAEDQSNVLSSCQNTPTEKITLEQKSQVGKKIFPKCNAAAVKISSNMDPAAAKQNLDITVTDGEGKTSMINKINTGPSNCNKLTLKRKSKSSEEAALRPNHSKRQDRFPKSAKQEKLLSCGNQLTFQSRAEESLTPSSACAYSVHRDPAGELCLSAAPAPRCTQQAATLTTERANSSSLCDSDQVQIISVFDQTHLPAALSLQIAFQSDKSQSLAIFASQTTSSQLSNTLPLQTTSLSDETHSSALLSLQTSDELTLEESGMVADDQGNEETINTKELHHVPYYLENFNSVLNSVLEDDYNLKLFDEQDMEHIAAYKKLLETSQKLYVRLFSRKLAWLPTSKIKYPEIAEELGPCFGELVTCGFLLSSEKLEDLPAVIGAMSAPALRVLAKSYHINPVGQQKRQIIQALISKSQQSTIASMFGKKIGGVEVAMLKRAKQMLGPLYRLSKEVRAVFVRVMMLFSLISTTGDEEGANGGQGQLFQMLLVNMGRIVYPAYTVNRQTQIFRCRQDLIRFEEALQLESELLAYTGAGKWKEAFLVFLTVKERYDHFSRNKSIIEWDSSLPEFLRYYTASSVVVRLLSQGIEILQRKKDYTEAVTLIRDLLKQNIYNLDLHGYWWDRLALNLDVHLKEQEQALQAVKDGLADPYVRTGHRLSLFLRAKAICERPESLHKKRLPDFFHDPLTDLPKRFVDGRVLSHPLPGRRYQFITYNSYTEGHSQEVTMCNVEQIVLDHYRNNGFPQGIHAEGSVISILFCLYLWDLLFMDVTDAFHSPFQTTPLDIHTDAFYQQRQECIDKRLALIENSTEEVLKEMLTDTWQKYQGVTCAGMNWERFSSVEEIQGLVRCMGGKVLAGILHRFARQPRHTRGGFPDLTLWNSETRQLKISEVKGPGDRLSHKQILWLDYLLKLGIDAEVCHVKPVALKKLTPAKMD